MDLKFCKNIKEKEYELILSGDVGYEIDSKMIANEIRYLNSIGATKITERINSPGGFVVDGFDIVDANLNSKAIIETIVTGLAASTAGWLAATGTKGYRSIVDYGKGMIHDPALGVNKIEDLEDGPEKEGLISIKDSISTILSNNSNLNKEKINQMMTKETWLSAEKWVDYGFADKVIPTGKKVKENLTMLEFVNACSNIKEEKPLNNDNDMDVKELENKVENLAGQVTAKDSQISDLENKVSEKDSLIAEMENKASEKDTQIAELKSQVESFENKEKDAAVDSAIKSGKFSEDNRTGLTEQVKVMGVENFNKMVEMAALPTANAIEQINNGGGSGGEKKKSPDEKLAAEYEDLSKNNPSELERIKNVEPARFEKMLEAWNK
jgi:ATP-dependent Clp protease protease subunit